MKQFMTFLKIEGKLSLRCPDSLIFGVGMPVGILFLIATIAGDSSANEQGITFLQSAFASLLCVGICATAFMGLPITIADYRDKKILKHFFVTPVHPMLILFTQMCIAMLFSILSALLVTIVAITLFQYEMAGNVLLFIAAYFLIMFSMYSIGMVIASLCKNIKITNVVTTFVYFPMIFLSGATIPYELFPRVLQNIADVLPLTHGIKLLKSISLGIYSDQMWLSVILLVVFMVVGSIISVVSFRWK